MKINKLSITLLAGISYSCSPVYAEFSQEGKSKYCQVHSEVAMNIMQARQRAVPINKVLDVFVIKDDPEFNAICKALTAMAYKHPRYNTKDYQQKAIADFGAQVYTTCIEQLK